MRLGPSSLTHVGSSLADAELMCVRELAGCFLDGGRVRSRRHEEQAARAPCGGYIREEAELPKKWKKINYM